MELGKQGAAKAPPGTAVTAQALETSAKELDTAAAQKLETTAVQELVPVGWTANRK